MTGPTSRDKNTSQECDSKQEIDVLTCPTSSSQRVLRPQRLTVRPLASWRARAWALHCYISLAGANLRTMRLYQAQVAQDTGTIPSVKAPIRVVGISYWPGPGVLDTTIFALTSSQGVIERITRKRKSSHAFRPASATHLLLPSAL